MTATTTAQTTRHAGRVETALAAAAFAVVAAHIVDDSFLQSQPGTSAGDHLASGLVPIAVLLLTAAAYGRLRAGLRAAIAIPLGLLAVVAGVGEAGYYSLTIGPSGDDYTGFLALVAGLLLVGLGTVTLWTTRRREGKLVRRYVRRSTKFVVAALGAYFVLLPLALSYVFTHAARAVVPAAELGAAYENVSFQTRDGLTLRGWYVPSRNRAAIIVAPGRSGSQRPARLLARHGYGVLLFDRRGEGASDGDPNAFGWGADRDVAAAVSYLQERPDVDSARIGGLGLSVGGETLLQAAAESDGLRAVVADGAGARSLREDLARPRSGKWSEVPTSLVITAGTMLFANQVPPPSLVSLVRRIAPRPVLFIYGEHDQANVRELTPRYYAAAGKPKTIWQVAGAGHTVGIDTRPRAYERHVVSFFAGALLGGPASLQHALDRVVAAGVPGAVVLARTGTHTTLLASGFANLEQTTPMRTSDRFRVGSITKTFVATVVLQLVGEGKLSLDDTVESRLPGVIPNGAAITIGQLLNMTSGLFDYLNDGDTTVDDRLLAGDLTHRWSPLSLIAISNMHARRFPPGTAWEYCSTCYILLGLIVEKRTGHPLAAELQRRIFVPAGLAATSFDTEPRISGAHAHGYESLGRPPLTDVSVLSPSHGWAAGALVSNAQDLARFYRALFEGRLLRPELVRRMQATVPVVPGAEAFGYGEGLFKEPLRCGTAFGHAGAFPGFLADAWSSRDGNRQAVLLVNIGEHSRSAKAAAALRHTLDVAYCLAASRP